MICNIKSNAYIVFISTNKVETKLENVKIGSPTEKWFLYYLYPSSVVDHMSKY